MFLSRWLQTWVLLGLWPALGCSEPQGPKRCLDERLGQFAPILIAPFGPDGCQADYQDPAGRRARVRVEAQRPGAFDQTSPPVAFEQQLVFFSGPGDSARVAWYADQVQVEVELPGASGPEGAVLRAYLHRYPSRVVDQVQATQRDVELLRQTSRLAPGDAGVHLKLARNYRKLGDTVMAAQEYHIAVDKDRTCHACYLEMGSLYHELRHWDLSIRALRKAAALAPAAPEAWLLLGDVCYQVRNRLEAMRGYRQALMAGLQGEERARAEQRLGELERGKFMIEVLPGAQPGPDGGG